MKYCEDCEHYQMDGNTGRWYCLADRPEPIHKAAQSIIERVRWGCTKPGKFKQKYQSCPWWKFWRWEGSGLVGWGDAGPMNKAGRNECPTIPRPDIQPAPQHPHGGHQPVSDSSNTKMPSKIEGMKIKNGDLYNAAGQKTHCGNYPQYCGQHCAMFEYRKRIIWQGTKRPGAESALNPKREIVSHTVILHCVKCEIKLLGAPEICESSGELIIL